MKSNKITWLGLRNDYQTLINKDQFTMIEYVEKKRHQTRVAKQN
ncbi:MAG: hypothetical protein QG628_363 [Patescibacteria group bacterium]|nr:hypothetical protein [Patescibacteria group bacterium]